MSVERWSIWRANLDPVVGSEQGLSRPVLVISQTALNDILPVVNVLPLTSRKAGAVESTQTRPYCRRGRRDLP
jgi:mRNA interferase MazF